MLRDLKPTDIICGYNVRPGYYDLEGASAVRGGVNFTISSVYATSCTLLLFAPGARTPYVRLPFPDSYRIGNTYSMIVFGLEIDKFEYAYSIDGPYDPKKDKIYPRPLRQGGHRSERLGQAAAGSVRLQGARGV